MSWTPTVEGMREVMLTGFVAYPGNMTDKDLTDAFDRWLAGEKAAAWNEGARHMEGPIVRSHGPECNPYHVSTPADSLPTEDE